MICDNSRHNNAFWFCKKKQYPNVISRAISNKNNKKHKVLVSRDRTFQDRKTGETRYIKAFGSYKSIDKVVQAINKYGNFNLYEVLEEQTPLKMYYDIEFPHKSKEKTDKILIDLVEFTKKIIIEIFGLSECFDYENIFCSGSIGKGKLRNEPVMKASYHFSFQCNSYFKNMKDLQTFMNYLKIRMEQEKEQYPHFFYTIKEHEECVIDWTVYKRNQQIKLPLQSKIGSSRVQELLNDTDKLEDHFYGYYGDLEYPDYFNISKVPIIVSNNNILRKRGGTRGGGNNTTYGNIYNHFKPFECIPEGDVKYDDIDYIIDSIDNSGYNQDYTVYIGMLCCIKNISDKDEIGFKRFLRWYKKSSYFTSEYEARRAWNSTVKRNDGYNIGTLKNLALLCNPKLTIKNPVKELTEIKDINFKTEIYNEKYQRAYNTDDYDCIIAESPMGSGKTYQISQLLRKIGLNKKILVLSPRRCFARSIASELTRKLEDVGIKFTCYLDLKSHQISKCQYLVCQMESLHLLENDYNILIADEFTSCLTQLSSTGTMKHNIKKVCDKFKEIWNNASKKIVCDAFINDKVIKFIEDAEEKKERKKRIIQTTINFEPKKKKSNNKYPHILYMKNEVKPVEREAVELKSNIFVDKLIDSLKNNKKVVFVTASRDKGNAFLQTIKKELKRDFTYKFYHSRNKEETEHDLKDVNKYWKVDLLIYTSSITVGVNFDIKWFDELFIYSSSCAGLVRDTFQSSMRVRHLKDNIMYFNLWTRCIDLDKSVKDNKNEIKKFIENKILEEEDIEKKIVKKKKLGQGEERIAYWDKMPLWLYNIHIQNKFEDNVSILKHRDLYLYYLKKLNYKLVNDTYDLEHIELTNISNDFIEYDDMKITQEEEDRILNKKENDSENMTNQELNKYQKIKFDENVNTSQDNNIIYNYFFLPEYYNVSKYYNLRNENMKDVYSVISKERRDRKFIELSDSRAVQLNTIKTIMKELGMKSSTDKEYKIDKKTLESKYKFILDNAQRWNNIFKIRKKFKKKESKNKVKHITSIVSPILNKWSGSTFTMKKRIQKRVNKKRVDCSIYGLNVALDIDICNLFKKPTI